MAGLTNSAPALQVGHCRGMRLEGRSAELWLYGGQLWLHGSPRVGAELKVGLIQCREARLLPECHYWHIHPWMAFWQVIVPCSTAAH